MADSFTIGEAKTQLSRLIRLVEDGDEVVIRRGDRPVARLVAVAPGEASSRRPGRMRGRVVVPDDFDDWPDDLAQALELND